FSPPPIVSRSPSARSRPQQPRSSTRGSRTASRRRTRGSSRLCTTLRCTTLHSTHSRGGGPYRPFYYPHRPGFNFSFASGSPYYGSPYYGSPYYGYPAYSPYAYPTPPAGYISPIPGRAYGGVRIEDAPQDGQVFADGYYMGVVDDFDNPFQHMNLEAGPQKIEIRAPGFEPVAFDVNVVPGETITFHAEMLPLQQ